MLKTFRLALAAGAVIVSLAGCTYSDVPAESGQTSSVPAPAAATASPAIVPVILEGTFQSQAFPTNGTATIRVTASSATLELKDFSTETAGDLSVVFSPGKLSPNAEGETGLASDHLVVVANLKLAEGDQKYELGTKMWTTLPSPARSVVIYNFPDRVAYGAANLTEVSPESAG
ncbi:DM13 domain-containing protein [Arthrobacter sp. NPDC058097]|uniref:DM13 domain-containing protein n=1 Tax=Arthrobacter sp. NPDC058097 TaxID=3346340 RepID=UPI0036DBCADA